MHNVRPDLVDVTTCKSCAFILLTTNFDAKLYRLLLSKPLALAASSSEMATILATSFLVPCPHSIWPNTIHYNRKLKSKPQPRVLDIDSKGERLEMWRGQQSLSLSPPLSSCWFEVVSRCLPHRALFVCCGVNVGTLRVTLLFGPSFPPTPRALNTPCNNQRKNRQCICFRLLPTLPHLMNRFRLVDQ